MAIGLGELLISGVIVGLIGLPVVGPIVGLVRARRRRRDGRHSQAAVLLAALCCGLSVFSVGYLPPVGVPALALSITWLVRAIQANRAAARLQAAAAAALATPRAASNS